MFSTRLVTAAALLALVVGALLVLPNKYWAAFLLPGLFIASIEWAALAGYGLAGRWVFGALVPLCGLALFYLPDRIATETAIPAQPQKFAYWISAVFWLVLAPLWLASKFRSSNALVLGVTGCVVLVPAWLALAMLQSRPALLLMLLGIVWVADSAAYVVGGRLGRCRLAPGISPRKTWEGVIGACLAVAVYYAVLWFIVAPQQPLLAGAGGIVLFAVVAISSVEGDLFESWMKRQAGVKDSGKLFPGHGGMLDRVDGLTSSMPLAALWIYYFGAIGLA